MTTKHVPVAGEAYGAALKIGADRDRHYTGAVELRFERELESELKTIDIDYDDFTITQLIAGPGQTTLPLYIWNQIRRPMTPEINAISTIIIVLSMGLMLLIAKFYRFGGERSGNE